jgi:hypothetical protein
MAGLPEHTQEPAAHIPRGTGQKHQVVSAHLPPPRADVVQTRGELFP